ncbi:bifunctional SulP family inorganic anion transporter/carbonic anhydrase [Stigmatella aurantiaca]|uniref:carbonic anhydrase n=1 Tax=Stigmatella aurantiaca (strain DW4/3-1) TaxID=378806 RepID=Q08Y26_STIAD|nr:bifunctional SulP family inorganic anion transporter/carbonic anhydrase [Stigmatella aurantiaca]ADO69981.1 Carbonate dehydratase [Stigmatella aurantiaca DW4/3-1]EAU65388.1 sulfate permease [Stigmatella aurantiaca DW4/3-1]
MRQQEHAERRILPASKMRFDLGIRSLLPEWKALFSSKYLKEDTRAGFTVAALAIPFSLSIALASGISPQMGLVTAILAGVMCSLFGGTPLTVSGPAVAMSVLIANALQQYGLRGVLLIGLVVGLLQILTGVLGLGKIIRFIPLPVVSGFTAGIGAIIFLWQLPRAFGLASPDQGHVMEVLTHLGQLIHDFQPAALLLASLTLAISLLLPRVWPQVPAPLIAVIAATVLNAALGLGAATVGEMSRFLPVPQLPQLPEGNLMPLLGTALIVYALASLEALLTGAAVNRLVKDLRHDPDQEMVGQGLGNAVVALFGGIPITGVTVRSATNALAGARTRRAAIIHSLVLLTVLVLFAPVMGYIPIASLAGVLLFLALRMLHPHDLMALWKVSRMDAAVYAITFMVIVLVDFTVGVQAGILAALAIAAVRLGQTQGGLLQRETPGAYRVVLSGPLTFMSSSKLDTLRTQSAKLDRSRGVVIDMSAVTAVDSSGADMLIGLVNDLLNADLKVVLQGLQPEFQRALTSQAHGEALEPLFALTESDVVTILRGTAYHSARERLVHGVERFRQDGLRRYGPLFDRLANGQAPHTLLITCADSRINPNLITSTDPGELFIVRNVGNLVPPASSPASVAVASAVEYAVNVLKVTDIIVCGHSACGAMNALIARKPPQGLPSVAAWLKEAEPVLEHLSEDCTAEEAAQQSALAQVENILSYEGMREKAETGEIRIHAWFYDVAHSELLEWSPSAGRYLPLGNEEPASAGPDTKASAPEEPSLPAS